MRWKSRVTERSLDVLRAEYARRRFLAMPLAGTIAWTLIGLASQLVPPSWMVPVTCISTGCIVYLGIGLSRLTGENFIDRTRPKNTFDSLFMHTVAMSVLVYAIAIPFALVEPDSLPMSIGVLAGLMWLPFSWIVQHWIGYFHAIVRTALVVAVWYAFPDQRYPAVSAVIVAVYAVTIAVFQLRWRRAQRASAAVSYA